MNTLKIFQPRHLIELLFLTAVLFFGIVSIPKDTTAITCNYSGGGTYEFGCNSCGGLTSVSCSGSISNCTVSDLGNGMCSTVCDCSAFTCSGQTLTSSSCDGNGSGECTYNGGGCGFSCASTSGTWTQSIGPCSGGGDGGGGGGGGGSGGFDFRIRIYEPTDKTINYGGTATYNAVIENLSSTFGTVSLSITGCPAGLPPISCGLTSNSAFMNAAGDPYYVNLIVQNANVPSGGVYTLNIVGNSNGLIRSASATLRINPPAPTLDLKVAGYGEAASNGPGYTYSGGTGTLSWTSFSVQPNSCNITSSAGGGSWNSQPASGSVTTPGLSASQTYTITCRGYNGASISDSVVLNVPPPPTNVTYSCPSPGNTINVSWTLPAGYTRAYTRVYNLTRGLYTDYRDGFTGTSLTLTNANATGGNINIGDHYSVWIHTYNNSNGAWSAESPAAWVDRITCLPPPAPAPDLKVTVWANWAGTGRDTPWIYSNVDGPVVAYIDAYYALSWGNVANATSCTLDGVAVAVTGGTVNSYAATGFVGNTKTHTLSCSGAGGSGSNSVVVNVPPPPTRVGESCSADGRTGTFSWTKAAGYAMNYVRLCKNNASGGCDMDQASITSGDTENYPGSSATFNATPGASYSWWVHTKDSGNGAWSGTASGSISCPNPAPTVNMKITAWTNWAGTGRDTPWGYNNSDVASATVYVGANFMLSWTTSNATGCNINAVGVAAGGGSKNDYTAGGPGWSTTYTISCVNAFSPVTATDQITVKVPPNPSNVNAACSADGETLNMSWTLPAGYTKSYVRVYDSTNPGGVSSNGQPGYMYYGDGYVGSSIALTDAVPGHTYTYWVHTYGDPYGAGSNEVPTAWTTSVTCNYPAPTADLKVNGSDGPVSVVYNNTATLSWTSGSTQSCTVNPGGLTGKTNAGTSTGNVTANTTYTLDCIGLDGVTHRTDTVTVNITYTYSWQTSSWGSCSATCGGGTHTRTVTCKRSDGATVDDSLCPAPKPATSEACGTGACPPNDPGPGPTQNSQMNAAVACNYVRLNWTDNSSDETGFKLYRDGVSIGVAAANATSFDYQPGDYSTHDYAVAATKGAGADSNIINASNNPVAAYPCSANLTASEKDIVGINYSQLSNAPYGIINGGTDPLPTLGVTSLREGNVLSFSITLRNENGSGDATNIVLEDTLINLVEPDAGWNAKFNGAAVTPAVSGSIYNQKLTFDLTGYIVPAHGTRSLTFDAKLAADPSLGGLSPRMQNYFIGQYDAAAGDPETFNGTTPLIPFSRGQSSPGILEIP